jgi:putative DNA primase/helicase
MDEVLLDAMRPAIINGIEELATRGDLLDRASVHTLPTIPDDKRCPEDEIEAEFEKIRPGLLGALLTAVSRALRDVGSVRLPCYPRMADFAKWVSAAEPALPWQAGEFLNEYLANRDSANVVSLEASPIYGPLVAIDLPFEGTASELLARLLCQLPDAKKQPKGWPANARSLSNALRRIAPNLRRDGIEVTFHKKERPRKITIERSAKTGIFASDATGEKPRAQGSDASVASDANSPTPQTVKSFDGRARAYPDSPTTRASALC